MANAQISYVIVGNGIAGITAAEELRALDPGASITIVADDPLPVYYRPALKDYLAGSMSEEKLWARPSSFYQEQRVGFIPGRVVGIDARQQLIQLHTGQILGYQTLLLAQGARAMPLSCPGINMAGVSTLRTVADYQAILRDLDHVRRVVICGSGTLAMESGEILKKQGCQVTHLLRGSKLWSDVLDPAASDLVLNEEIRAGIDVRTNDEIAEIIGKNGHVSAVMTKNGTRIPCELVLVAIGIKPNIDFIRGHGIACQRGIYVDPTMQTSTRGIYAAGDVIETVDEVTGQKRLLGQWYPAIQQAHIAAYNMFQTRTSAATVNSVSYNYYNASFLYGLDFVSIGLTSSPVIQGSSIYQEIIAPAQPRNYRKVLLKRGVLAGALFLGNRQQALAFKRAIDHEVNVTSIADRLFDKDFAFDAWLDEQHVPSAVLTLQPGTNNQTKLTKASQPEKKSGQLQLDRSKAAEEQQTQEALLVPIPHPRVQVSLHEFPLQPDRTTTIGRQAGAALLVEHRSVSRHHAEITYANGSYVISDRGSSNGTFINNTPLPAGQAHVLHQSDHIRMGDIQFRFEWHQGTFQHLQGTQLYTNATRRIPAEILASLPTTPALVLISQSHAPSIVALQARQTVTIGRDASNTLSIQDPATSHTHAEFFPTQGGFYVRDLNSRNGTFVNTVKINNPYHLFDGDSVVIGNVLLYYSDPPTLSESMNGTTTHRQPVVNPNSLSQLLATPLPVPGLSHLTEIQPFAKDRIQFEVNMCIGCDRCMVACPVPLSSTVTITDLNQATLRNKITPNVAQFTQACIMCGSCVPVCPVDNHRDLLMLSLKQRLGSSWEEPANTQQITAGLPKGWTLSLLLQLLRQQPALTNPQQVSDNYLLHLVAASEFLILQPGETVIQEGTYGRDLYFILEGRLALFAIDSTQTEFPVAVLNRGEHVGEDGMLTGQLYNATARVQMPAVILQVPEQVMQHLMELVPQVRTFFNQINNTRSLQSILKRMVLFRDVADADINMLIQQAQVQRYERNERLFAEGQEDQPARETLHILLEGFVKVAHALPTKNGATAERVMAYRQSGDYFAGGLDLLGDGKAVTVTTINRVRVAEIPRRTMLALFQRYPEVNQRFADRLREYVATATASIKNTQSALSEVSVSQAGSISDANSGLPMRSSPTGLHSLVSQGVVEGTEVLVIDLDKCIHCNECEEACERRHGHSRMNRKGKVIGNISITTTCRQCQDPVCMLCSRAGIARRPNGEVYITESCIGCGICAERCPYGAISIVDADGETGYTTSETKDENTSWLRFNNFFTKGTTGKQKAHKPIPVVQGKGKSNEVAPGPLDSPTHDAYNDLRKKIAIKCDLCAGYNNQACVQACPTGAAIRVQPTKFFGTTEEILRRQL